MFFFRDQRKGGTSFIYNTKQEKVFNVQVLVEKEKPNTASIFFSRRCKHSVLKNFLKKDLLVCNVAFYETISINLPITSQIASICLYYSQISVYNIFNVPLVNFFFMMSFAFILFNVVFFQFFFCSLVQKLKILLETRNSCMPSCITLW